MEKKIDKVCERQSEKRTHIARWCACGVLCCVVTNTWPGNRSSSSKNTRVFTTSLIAQIQGRYAPKKIDNQKRR